MLENKFNIDSYLQEIIPSIIDAFADFYGESERDSITKTFNKYSIVFDSKKEIKDLAMKRFFELIKADYDEELAKILFGTFYSIENGTLHDYYTKRNSDYFKSVIDRFLKNIKNHYQTQGKTVNDEEIYHLLDSYEPAYKEAVSYEEKLFNEKYGKYQEYYDYINQIKEDMNKKYLHPINKK